MHFWINKPAGRYYGFTGRRYPATPVPKTRNQCRRSGEHRQMVTPVHRFQGLAGNLAAGNTSSAGPSNVNNSCRSVVARSTTTSTQIHNDENRHRGSSSLNAAQLAQLNNIPNNVTDASNNQLILSNTTGANGNRNLLCFFEVNDTELAGYRIRCGVWITFVVATVFVAAAKFYFGYRGPGLEILMFCGLLILLLSACLYSIFCRRHGQSHYRHSSRSEHNARIQEDHIAALTNTSGIGESVIGRATPTVPATTMVRQNPPPPPYHIAILIPPPPPICSDEAPPPSYDKVMR